MIYPNGQDGQLTKEDGIKLCRRFRGEMATIGQLAEAASAGASWTSVGWVLESGFGWRPQAGVAQEMRWCGSWQPKSSSCSKFQYEYDVRANPICYGPKPTNSTGFTIVNFNTSLESQSGKSRVAIEPIPQSVADLPILQTTSSTGPYKMFDLAPIYAQLNIAALEYPTFITQAQQNESDILNLGWNNQTAAQNFYYANSDDIRRLYFSYWLNPFLNDTPKLLDRNSDGFQRYINQTNQRIKDTYDLSLFANHPLGYILSGEKLRPTKINCAPIFIQNLPEGRPILSDVNQKDYASCEQAFNTFSQTGINYFTSIPDLFVPLGKIEYKDPNRGVCLKYEDTRGIIKQKFDIYNSDETFGSSYMNCIFNCAYDADCKIKEDRKRYWETWMVNNKSLLYWNLDSYLWYSKYSLGACSIDIDTQNAILNNNYDARFQLGTPYPSRFIIQMYIDSNNCPKNPLTPVNCNKSEYIKISPDNIIKNKCYTPPSEVNPISPIGILSGQTWSPTLQRTDTIAQSALDAWNALKASKGGETFWKTIPLVGTMSQTNRDEMNRNISYSLYFNFSNTGLAERQLRVSSQEFPGQTPPYKLFFSPTFSAKNEFYYKLVDAPGGGKTIYQGVDPYAKLYNDTYANVEITTELLKYIPYHAARYMTKWGDYRYNRIKAGIDRVSTLGNATPYSGRLYKPPVFDMNTPLSTMGSFTREKKQGLLDKMAQFYYDSATDKQKIIKSFYDCYQVADTLFDVRYEIQEKTSAEIRARITSLTTEYLNIRSYPMSVVDLANLEFIYNQKLKDLYDKESKNIDNYGENCSDAKNVKYVRIEANDPTKYMYISQVILVNNYGENVARYGQVTNSTMSLNVYADRDTSVSNTLAAAKISTFAQYLSSNVSVASLPYRAYLFPGEEELPSILRTSPAGIPLTSEQNQKYCDSKNALKRREKLNLLVDGTLRPRPPPNVFKSIATGPEYLLVNIGSPDQIVAVKLVLPAIPSADSDINYKVTLLNSNLQQVGSIVYVSTSVGSSSRVTSVGNFLLAAGDPKRSPNCPADLYNRFRTARFFATIADGGLTNGQADLGKITFTGYSEAEIAEEGAALTFNPRYNCGFDLPIDDRTGNCVYKPKTLFNKNFSLNAQGVVVNCADATEIRNALTEYRLSLLESGFKGRPDVVALPEAQKYNLDSSFFPSTVTKYAQVNPSTCAFVFQEVQVNSLTNQLEAIQNRNALIRFKPDTENWYSNKVLYDIPSSIMYSSESAMMAAPALQGKTLTTLSPPVSVPIPIQPRLSLDTGSGACPERTCSEMDVINTLASQFNNKHSDLQILRVNRAVTVTPKRCDYEVVFGDYSANGQSAGIVSTVSIYSELDTSNCTYKHDRDSVGTGFLADGNQPLLSKIYTYASDLLDPIYKSLYKSISSVNLTASAQLDTTKQTIAQALGTYRTNVLSAYGALKQLDGCSNTDWSTIQNRCYASETVNEFIKTYNRTKPYDGRLRQVLRAAGASGTECDFTFETEDLQVQNGSVVGGNRTTRGMRCRMKKDPFNCAFTVDSAGYVGEEVYQVSAPSGVNYTFDEAAIKCRELNGRLATYNELAHAFRDGAEWCDGGWVVDSEGVVVDTLGRTQFQTNLYFPNRGGCGPTTPGILSQPIYTSTLNLYESPARRELRGAATCIGIKPDQTAVPDTTIRAFSTNQYRSPVSAFEGCIPLAPMPPTAQDLADLGFRPTTASPSATVSTMTVEGPTGRQIVSGEAVPQLDYADCKSNLLVSDAVDAGVSLPITSIEQVGISSCIYNGNRRINYNYNPATRTYTRVGTAINATTLNAANRITFSYTARPPTAVNPPITGDSVCSQPQFLSALSTIGIIPLAGRKWWGTTGIPDDNSYCDYRITARDNIPFENTFLRVRYTSTFNALGVGIRSIQTPDEVSSRFRATYNGTRIDSLLSDTGFQQYISTVVKQSWNTRFFDSITPDESYVRDGTGRLSTIGSYRTRMGKIVNTMFLTSEYALILQATTATQGKYGPTDIRAYNPAQQFKVRFRNPYAQPTQTALYSLEPTSGYTGPFTAFSDPDTSVRTATEALTPVAGGEQPEFRMLRFRVDTPSECEIARLSFYSVAPGATGVFNCPTTAPTTSGATGITSVYYPNAYVTLTGYDGLELQPATYTPPSGVCVSPYTQGLDPYTRFSTCTLNIQQVPDTNRGLYLYPKPTTGAECQIGYTDTEGATKCALTYNFQEVLGPFCEVRQTTALKRLKLRPSQWLTVYFNEYVKFNAFSVTAGAGGARLPATCTVQISVNGVQWVPVAESRSLGLSRQLQTSPILQFFTGTTWSTGTPAVVLPDSTVIREAFQSRQSEPQPLAQPTRPSWLRVTVLETRNPASKYATMGQIQFETTLGSNMESRDIKVTNFGGSRKSAKEGPDALLDQGSGRFWVDYMKAPLLFRFPDHRPPIKGFRFTTPGTLEGNGALPKRFRLENSWDGRVWTPVEEDTRAPADYTGLHAFCRFMKPI